MLLCAISSLLSVSAENYPYRSDYLWVAEPDHADWLYKTGERAKVDVRFYIYGIPQDMLDIEITDDEYDTIAGLVISQLDRVPEEKEKPVVNYKNLRIKVLKVEENAIAKVLIHINPVVSPEAEDGEGEKKDVQSRF